VAPQREWFEKDYYKVLGVADSATAKEITKAYRALARKLHPDANPDDPKSEERFKEVSAAYDVVGDDEKRREYDEVRRLGPAASGFGGGGSGGPGGFGGQQVRFEDLGDMGDVLGNLFGGSRRGGGGGRTRAAGPQKGGDLEAELTLSFVDAAHGVTTTLHLTSDTVCSTCHGNGAKPGTSPTTCPDCQGRGTTADNQGFFSFSQPCRRCGGAGSVIDDPCPTCAGRGTERRAREVKVRIPAGVADAQRIRLAGRGSVGRHGGPAGDLFVVVHVTPHAVFARDGLNLTVTVPITFPEAALGADLTVPTLDGETVKVRIPAGTRSGRVLRVKGRGLTHGHKHGDLLVTVEVAVPTKLTDEQRSAIDAFAAATTESPRAHLFAAES
jgi:molecular chaperone DnaJ